MSISWCAGYSPKVSLYGKRWRGMGGDFLAKFLSVLYIIHVWCIEVIHQLDWVNVTKQLQGSLWLPIKLPPRTLNW